MATKTKRGQEVLAEILLGDPEPGDIIRPRPTLQSLAIAHFQMLSIGQIEILDNVRKTFDEAALTELAESIREHGILQPIVVREFVLEGRYQLVAGERRVRAAQRAGLTEVPCMVRHLNDKQFYEVQILENLQRRDVHPLEEAEGFRKLLQHGFTEEDIADKLGKTRTFIAQRLRLNNLIPVWTEYLRTEKLTLGGALLLARLDKAGQETVFKKSEYYGRNDGWNSRVVQSNIDSYVYLDLSATAFPKDDAELNPARGACLSCAKRTGYNKTLFPEIDEQDYCMDAVCFQIKKDNFVTRQKQHLESQGEPFVNASSNWYLSNASKDIVTSGEYDIVGAEEVNDQCKKAILIDGDEAGKEVMIKLRHKKEVLETPEQKEKARLERLATIRDNKIKIKVKQLTAEALYLQLREPEGIRETLAFFLHKKLGYGTISKDTKALLQEQYEFPEYYDSAYNAKKSWLSEGIAKLSTQRMLELYFHYNLIQSAAGEYDSTIMDLAPKVLPLLKQYTIQEEATALVDKTKKAKKGAAAQ